MCVDSGNKRVFLCLTKSGKSPGNLFKRMVILQNLPPTCEGTSLDSRSSGRNRGVLWEEKPLPKPWAISQQSRDDLPNGASGRIACMIWKTSFGYGSKSMVLFWGRCTTHFSLFSCGLGCSLGVRAWAFDPWPSEYVRELGTLPESGRSSCRKQQGCNLVGDVCQTSTSNGTA